MTSITTQPMMISFTTITTTNIKGGREREAREAEGVVTAAKAAARVAKEDVRVLVDKVVIGEIAFDCSLIEDRLIRKKIRQSQPNLYLQQSLVNLRWLLPFQ